MEKLPHTIQQITMDWPSSLNDAEAAAKAIGIPAERLTLLADGGYAPHFRIDGGRPFFKISELKRWAAANLLETVEGKELPRPIRVVIEPARVSNFRTVPTCIREIEGLRDITGEVCRTGIYFLCSNTALLYIGQSVNASGRITEHSKRINFDAVYFLPWPGDDLNRIEAALIQALRPPLNGKTRNGHMISGYINETEATQLMLQLKGQQTANHSDELDGQQGRTDAEPGAAAINFNGELIGPVAQIGAKEGKTEPH